MSNITSQLSVKLSLQGAEQVRSGMKQAEGGVVSFAAAADEARKTMLSLTGSLAGAVSVQQFFQAADAVTTLNNQLNLATGSTQSAGQAYETLFKIAQDSRVSFTELGRTFASVSRAGQELGISQQRLLTVTESIGNAMTISGGSAASMQAALVQLGQGIASETLRGEELNSVMEQTPRLAKALADGLGVPIGKLREMGAAGQITSEQVISALEGQAAVLRGEVAGSTLLVAQAFTQLQNASTKAVGQFDAATGASNALAIAISGLSSSVSTVGQAFKDNEPAITTTLGLLGGAAVGTALARTAVSLGSVATGVGSVAGAVAILKGVVSALNPATLVLLGLGTAVGGFVAYNAAQAKTADGIRRTIKELEALNKTGPGIYNRDAAGIASYNKSVDERTAKIRELRGQLAQMDAQNLDTKAEDARLLRHVASAKSVTAKGAAYDDLRTRLSAFRGDYAKYQADLKAIQEGMAKGEANGGLSEKEGIAMLTELAKKHGEVAKAATGRASAEATVGESAALYAKSMNMLMDNTVDAAAATNGYTKTQKDLLTVFSSPGFASMPDAWKQTIAAQAEAVIATEQLTEAEKALATARAGSLKLSEAAEEAQAASADQLAERLASMRDEIALIGLTAQQVAELTAAKAEQVIADKEIELIMLRNADASAAQISALEREINLRRQLVGAMRDKTVKEAAAESADQAQKEWKKASEQIEQSLTDALMRGFEGGKGFAENLRDTIENMFKTLVLRPIVSAVVSPVSGAITAGLGLPGAASAQGGNMLGSMVNNYASGAIGASLWGSSAAYGAALGTTSIGAGSQAAMLAAQTGAFGSAGTAATAAAAGNAGMSAVMTAAPYLGAALAVAAIIKSMDDSGTMHTGGIGGYSAAGGTATGAAAGLRFGVDAKDYTASAATASAQIAQSIVGMLDSTATTFGKKAGYYAATAFADDTSKDGAWGALMIKMGDQVLLDWANNPERDANVPRVFANGEAGAKEYAAAVATDVRDYLITQTPAWADTMLTALGDAPSLEQLAATVGQINATATALEGMGRASQAFANLAESATNTLITALGGGEAAVANLGSYYTNYYSQADRAEIATRQLTEQLANLGVALPETRDAYRDLVDNALASGNQQLAADLIKLSGAYATVSQSADDLAASAQQAAERTSSSFKNLMQSIESSIKSVAAAEAEIADLELQSRIDAANAANDAARAMGDAAQTLRDYVRGQTTTPQEQFADLLRRAMQGDATALQALPSAATAANDAALSSARTAAEYAIARAKTLVSVSAAADLAQSRSGLVDVPTGESQMSAALRELAQAITAMNNDVTNAISFDLVNKLGEIDTSGDSAIQFAELKAAFGNLASESTLVKVFGTLDLNGDGQITLLESIQRSSSKTADNTYGLDRIGRVKSVVDSLNWGTAEWDASSTKTMAAIANQQGWTAQDISAAIGGHLSASNLVKFFGSYGQTLAPGFASVTSGGGTGSSGGFVIGGGTALKPSVMELVSRYDYTEGPVKDASIASLAGALKQYGYTISDLASSTGYSYADWLENFTSRGIPAFASGGVFSNGIVTRPTAFDIGLMGEAGDEAIMPLSRMPNGQLGVAAYSGGRDSNAAVVAELIALRNEFRTELQNLRAETRATAINTGRLEQLTKRVTRNGEAMQTQAVPA